MPSFQQKLQGILKGKKKQFEEKKKSAEPNLVITVSLEWLDQKFK